MLKQNQCLIAVMVALHFCWLRFRCLVLTPTLRKMVSSRIRCCGSEILVGPRRVNLNQKGAYEFSFSALPSAEFYTQILLGMKRYFNVRPRLRKINRVGLTM